MNVPIVTNANVHQRVGDAIVVARLSSAVAAEVSVLAGRSVDGLFLFIDTPN
jgi:hypothetical protein